MGGHRKPGPIGRCSYRTLTAWHSAAPPSGSTHSNHQDVCLHPAGFEPQASAQAHRTQIRRIVIVYNPDTSAGQLFAVAFNGTILLHGNVVVGGKDTPTPTGTFHASHWEANHVSSRYGAYANTPWNKSPLGLNAFGPYQLHIKELEHRGIYLHGTMGPAWNPFTSLNSLLSPASHGCVRMSNKDDIALHNMAPQPEGIEIIISTKQSDIPQQLRKP
jgi:lipoprotein-anchoring transpeptidase ErfK/SrfK